MKIWLLAIICGCVLVAVGCIIIGNYMFDIRASGLVFAAIMATIGMFEGINSIENLDNDDSGDDENDSV